MIRWDAGLSCLTGCHRCHRVTSACSYCANHRFMASDAQVCVFQKQKWLAYITWPIYMHVFIDKHTHSVQKGRTETCSFTSRLHQCVKIISICFSCQNKSKHRSSRRSWLLEQQFQLCAVKQHSYINVQSVKVKNRNYREIAFQFFYAAKSLVFVYVNQTVSGLDPSPTFVFSVYPFICLLIYLCHVSANESFLFLF